MNKKNYILNNANTRYFDYFFFKKLKGSEPEPTPAVEGEGNNFTLVTGSNKKIAEVKCKGDTLQNGSPSPDNPVDVQVVTGTQTVTITNGTNTQSYAITLGSLELCKINTYQDYIYKSGDDWYIHKELGKLILNGIGDYGTLGDGTGGTKRFRFNESTVGNIDVQTRGIYSNRYQGVRYSSSPSTPNSISQWRQENMIAITTNKTTYSLVDFKADLASNPVTVYYILDTITSIKITDTTLISNLNKILTDGYLKKGSNTISVTSTGTNLPSIIYIKSN